MEGLGTRDLLDPLDLLAHPDPLDCLDLLVKLAHLEMQEKEAREGRLDLLE